VLKLIIEDDEGRKTVVPFVRDEITIGRQEGNTIRLTERNVSRRHARLLRQQTNVLIEDLGSYNGIKVNGDRITGQVQVQDGDLIQIGDYDLAIQREEEARAAATVPLESSRASGPAPTQKLPDPSATMPALPVVSVPEARDDDVQEAPSEEVPRHQSTAVIRIDQVQSSRPQRSSAAIDPSEAPRLVVLNTDFAGREFACTKTELRIGRTDDNDIAIDHRSLSRTHCKVVREDSGEWKVIDMQSANGLMVNGEPYAQVTLRLGDVLELGHVKLKFVGAGDSVTINGASSNVTSETEASGGSSRGPLIAVVVALLVVVAGGGGYAFYRSAQSGTGGTDPVVKPTPPVANTAPVEPVKPPAVDPGPPPVDTAAENDKLVAEATALMAKADFMGAEAVLRNCKVGSSPCPAGRKVLSAIPNEKQFDKALNAADAALKAGEYGKAGPLLEAAKNTEFQKDRFVELQSERSRQVEAALKAAKEPVAPPPSAAGLAEKLQRLLEDAKQLSRSKDYDGAMVKLNECVKLDRANVPCLAAAGSTLSKAGDFKGALERLNECVRLEKNNPDCIVTMASVYAKRGERDQNAQDSTKARELYQKFLDVAAPGDSRVQRVKDILAGKTE
jgi:ABC transport system ATP-binding/permease protein